MRVAIVLTLAAQARLLADLPKPTGPVNDRANLLDARARAPGSNAW